MTQAYALVTTDGNITAIHHLPDVNAEVSRDAVLEAVNDKRVLLHIHGGLVPQDVAKASANRLSQTGDGKGVSYPADRAEVQLYLIWPADIITTTNDLLEDTVFGKVVTAITKWFDKQKTGSGARDGSRGSEEGLKGGASDDVYVDDGDLQQFYDEELKEIDPELQRDNNLVKMPPTATGQRGFLSLSLIEIAIGATRGIYARRNNNPDGYEFEAMVREEVMKASGLGLIGQQIWAQMKATAVQHATANFQEFLQDVYTACSELTLVGHSTGANIITALLPTLKAPAPDPKKLKVVFLAPAVTIQEFTRPRNIAAFTAHLMDDLRIYAMASKVEFKDKIKWQEVVFYPGSLLQLVNFVFERPNPGRVLGMVHYAEAENFGSLPVQIITEHQCESHGGFDDAPDILSQV